MREEAVRRESAANLEKARHQIEVARQLVAVASELKEHAFAAELLRVQVLADMDSGGKVIVIDSKHDESRNPVVQQLAESVAAPYPVPPPEPRVDPAASTEG